VLEGDFDSPGTRFAIRLTPRRALRFDGRAPAVMGTTEGVWPGILIEHGGPKEQTAHAAPTGSAWIHTNTGFLRYVRAATPAVFWMGNRPPAGEEFPAQRYVQVIADAATVGARWIVSLDDGFSQRLLKGDAEALQGWQEIQDALRFYEEHKQWRAWKPYAELALVQDQESGALVTGNLLDMLAVMNTPVKAVPSRELSEARLQGAKVTVALHADSYTAEQQALIRKFASGGGTLVTGPEGFRVPDPKDGRITFDKAEYQQLEKIWPELHVAVQRKNFGVRMFNVSGTLSYLLKSPDGGSKALLHLVNYTGYPVENLTAFVQGKYRQATLHSPGEPPKKLEVYDSPEGTGVEIEQMGAAAAVVLEQ
jgi:hypothetical protein